MSTDHRTAVVLAVVDLLDDWADLAGVQVEAGWPGDNQRDEAVWVDEMDGTLTLPATGPATVLADDEFRIPIEVRVAQAGGLARTRARLGEIVAAVTDAIRSKPDLDDLAGTGWALLDIAFDGSQRRDAVWDSPGGALGAARLEPVANVRLTSES